MNESYDTLLSHLRKLPGIGYRSAERIAVYLLTSKNCIIPDFIKSIELAHTKLKPCVECGHLTENTTCEICSSNSRISNCVCIVESVLDLLAIERSGTWNGLYHVINGRLSPINGVMPEDLNLKSLTTRVKERNIQEVIFALSNDIESNATCHYIQDLLSGISNITFTQVGFGLPSGGGITFADSSTLKSAFDSRRSYR